MEKENKKAKAAEADTKVKEETKVEKKPVVDRKKFIARKLLDLNNKADKATAKALAERVIANK